MATPWDSLQDALAVEYRIERELGRGGMAIVYLAHDLRHKRRVAIKVLQGEIAAAMGSERFAREIEVSAGLLHPNILPLYDSGVADGALYYVMPFIEGESLRDRLNRERQLPLGDAIRIAREVAEALAAAHARGVVHRDIKPENVLLDSGRALVADFGIARAMALTGAERITGTGLSLGTPSYMSPEQASGERDIDGRSDVYALGCVLYEMLIGEPPYTGPTAQAIIARRLTEPVPRMRPVRDTVPPSLEAVVVKALARAPADRFASARELADTLATVEKGGTWAPDVGGPAGTPPAPGLPRSTGTRAALGVLLVALIGGAAWYRTRDGRSAASPETTAAPASVAVLYLENLSPDTLDAYLAYGLTEEITSRLAGIGSLQVKSRSAVRRVTGERAREPMVAGRLLNVRYLVEGGVRRAGDHVRVSVRLLTAGDGFVRWSGDIDVTSRDLLMIQDSVARQVATTIGGRLTSMERSMLTRAPTTNAAAYDHYLRGSYLLSRRDPESVRQAIGQFQAALALDSSFAAASGRLAYGYALFADWGWPYPGLTSAQVLRNGGEAASIALARDSASADAWLARGYLLLLAQPRTREGVNAAFERAIALDSTNAEAFYQYGQALMSGGNDSLSLAMYARATALDPEWASPMMSSGGVMVARRNLPAALDFLDRGLAADSASSYARAVRSMIHLGLGHIDAAARDAESSLHLASGYRIPAYAALAQVAVRRGDSVSAAQWIGKALAETGKGSVSATDANFVGSALVEAGRREEALELLERVQPRGGWLWFYVRKATFDPIRNDPRFRKLMDESRPPGAIDVR